MTNPPLDLLKYRAFPELAEAVRARVAKVIGRFQQIVRQVLPAAEEMTLAQLVNSLPSVLRQIAEALESDEPAATFELLDVSQPHGELRFHQNYNVNELLIEYHLIRRIVIEEASDAIGRPLSAAEVVALNLGIDTSARRGVVAFIDSQTRQLREVNDLQSRYLSFLSHDLRGGLNGTLLMVEVLKRELAGADSQPLEDLEVMRRSILETVATLDHFLNAERLRKGGFRPRPSRVEVAAVVQDALAKLHYVIEEKALRVSVDVPGDLRIVTDRELLVIVIEALLNNAVKFTRKGTVSLSASRGPAGVADSATDSAADDMARHAAFDGDSDAAGEPVEVVATARVGEILSRHGGEVLGTEIVDWDRRDPASGQICTITIRDQGPGIAEDHLQSHLNSDRLPNAVGKKVPGMGLFIARQAADLIGAKITAASELGTGTTFVVTLPATMPSGK